MTMRSPCLLLLASLTVCNLTACGGQALPADSETIDDLLLHRAEGLLLRSILKKIEEGGANVGVSPPQPEWMTKRQHPGKRYESDDADLEKRQHPGRREEEEEDELDYADVVEEKKRQHPGKREEEDEVMNSFVEFQKRQHPGKRSMLEELAENLSELSKRQHPGKRLLVTLMPHSKRQHPGRRDAEEEDEAGGDDDDDDDDDGDLLHQELEKRQHPGKRFLDFGTNSPCAERDPADCTKTSMLLQLLDSVKSRAEEKRQHPGKRLVSEEDVVEQE